MEAQKDTIAAISTPAGTGGIAVIRISGPEAVTIVEPLFEHRVPLTEVESHRAVVGYFSAEPGGEPLDQVVVTLFRAPHSYTGEDVVEISCHGGRYLAQVVLEAVLNRGARLAEPGEFTKRAFLNGRIDLAQAEAVVDLIQAQTRESLRYAARQLRGGFSRQIEALRERIVAVLANLELELDFVEEDITLAPAEEVEKALKALLTDIGKLLRSYSAGRLIHEGVRTVIVGKPNVGKSSLFNALLGYERAIVDEVPGTTRDALEAHLDIGGTLFRFVDTAGLRQSRERIEKKGMEITEKYVASADLILFVADVTSGFAEEDRKIWKRIAMRLEESREEPGIVFVWNKIDLNGKEGELPGEVKNRVEGVVSVSARRGDGLDRLHDLLAGYVKNRIGTETGEIVTNVRHRRALDDTRAALERALSAVEKGMSGEFVAVDLREALDALGRIVGKTTPEDVLGYIFEHFCIGK